METRRSWTRWPRITLLALFIGLLALQLYQGVLRLGAIREERRRAVIEEAGRGHVVLARALAAAIEARAERARLLARLPAVRRAAGAGAGDPQLQDLLQELLDGQEDLGCIALLDRGGTRIAAVGEAPADGGPARWDGEWLVLLASVPGSDATLLVRARTAPLLAPMRAFRPLPGATSFVFDAAGDYLAHDVRAKERGGRAPSSLPADDPAAAGALLAGAASARGPDALLLAEAVSAAPPLWLGLRLPDASVDAAVDPQGGEYVRNVLVMAAASLLLGIAYLFLQGVVERAMLLRETERYLERIRSESRRYRALLEGAADLVVLLDPEERTVREANGLAREALAPGAAGAGAPLEGLLDPAGVAALDEALRGASERPGQVLALQGLRLRGARGPLEADARLVALDLADGRVVQVALRDMTAQRRMERQLATADRLSALGLLTAGVAHEINNPLEGIGNYLALLDRAETTPERRRRHLEQVRHGFARIREIVRGLLDFVRPGVERGQADLCEVARRARELVRYADELREVEVELADPTPGGLLVEGDPGRLEQVLINLLLNAGQAMGGRGRIRLHARRDDDSIVLCVDDQGPGIPPERLGSLFDPFFSAGEDGSPRGTGLGLSVSYGIARAHGGDLTAENLPGGGARFQLRLPAAGATIGSRG